MNQSSVTPQPQGGSSTMKWLLIILVIIIVLGGGYWAYVKYGKTSATTSTTSPSPATSLKVSPSTSAAVSPTAYSTVPADWKTYTNEQFGFSFKYPSELTKEKDNVSNQATDVVFKKGSDTTMIIRIYSGSNDGHGGATYFEVARSAQKTFPAGTSDEFVFPNGNGFGETRAYIAERFIKNSVVYAFEFYGKTQLSDQDSQILSTFQFTQ